MSRKSLQPGFSTTKAFSILSGECRLTTGSVTRSSPDQLAQSPSSEHSVLNTHTIYIYCAIADPTRADITRRSNHHPNLVRLSTTEPTNHIYSHSASRACHSLASSLTTPKHQVTARASPSPSPPPNTTCTHNLTDVGLQSKWQHRETPIALASRHSQLKDDMRHSIPTAHSTRSSSGASVAANNPIHRQSTHRFILQSHSW